MATLWKRAVPLAVLFLALAGCKPPGGTDACIRLEGRPARIFALSVPGSASAAAPVPIKAWVLLSGTEGGIETLQRETFSAKLKDGRILVTGQVTGHVQTGAPGCAYPQLLALPKAEAVDLTIPLPSGIYSVEAETTVTPPSTLWEQGTFGADVPQPTGSVTLTVS